jgi:2,5-diamino-6-(ribosylamino)-4(3H)-pyrimidinone 5'-phosphate reductase
MKIEACLAISVDGKLTAYTHTPNEWVKLGTVADLNRLFSLRNQADALLFGANTWNAWPKVRKSLANQQAEQQGRPFTPPVHVVLSKSWCFSAEVQATLQHWQPHWPAVIVASPNPPPQTMFYSQLIERGVIHYLALPGSVAVEINPVSTVVAFLKAQGIQHLLVEGGGDVVRFCLQAKMLERLHLTLTPWLLGGSQLPSLVGGFGGFSLAEAPHIDWETIAPVAQEVFLTGRVVYASTDQEAN